MVKAHLEAVSTHCIWYKFNIAMLLHLFVFCIFHFHKLEHYLCLMLLEELSKIWDFKQTKRQICIYQDYLTI